MGKIGFSKQFAKEINGQHTEFVYHSFDNKWMLLITQLGRLPALYNVSYDVKLEHRVLPLIHGPVESPTNHVSVGVLMDCVMGADMDEVRGAIQFLINKSELSKCPSELIIGLGLKQLESADLRAVVQVLQEDVFESQAKPVPQSY